MTSKIATNKFAAAALAVLIGAGLTAPAFAADPAQPAGKTVTQTAPKAKHDAVKADSKATHDQTAKHKPDSSVGGAKVDKTAPVKNSGKTL
jgi:hypothetical protein